MKKMFLFLLLSLFPITVFAQDYYHFKSQGDSTLADSTKDSTSFHKDTCITIKYPTKFEYLTSKQPQVRYIYLTKVETVFVVVPSASYESPSKTPILESFSDSWRQQKISNQLKKIEKQNERLLWDNFSEKLRKQQEKYESERHQRQKERDERRKEWEKWDDDFEDLKDELWGN